MEEWEKSRRLGERWSEVSRGRGRRWWDPEVEREPEIQGWWTIGRAEDYEVNDYGVVRHRATGQVIEHEVSSFGTHFVTLKCYEGWRRIAVATLVRDGRLYQNVPEIGGGLDGGMD